MKDSLIKHLLVKSAKIIGFVIFFLSQSCLLLFPQLPLNKNLSGKESRFSEELYLTTDRDLYIAGEKVWFRICKSDGNNMVPSNLSKVIYVDLLDDSNNPVKQLKIGSEGYSGSGVLILPDTLRTGYYFIRSCTSWMQNFSEDLFSLRKISVINPFITGISKAAAPDIIADSVIFYPEGGHLLAGVESKLGFRSLNKNGDQVALAGFITNDKNDTICAVRSEKSGYGWIDLKPTDPDKLYLVTKNNAQIRKFRLPDIQNAGIILSAVKKTRGSAALIKARTSGSFSQRDLIFYLVISSPGQPDIKKVIVFGDNGESDISQNEIPFGLSHLMITGKENDIISERWIYKEKGSIRYSINIVEPAKSSREKIKVEITADNNGKPVESDFSISVVKSVSVNGGGFNNNKYRQLPGLTTIISDKPEPDINDYLIFYSPDESFLSSAEKFSSANPAHLPELEGHLISGAIKVKSTGEPLKNENISLSFVGKVALCQFTKTDENGQFFFNTTVRGPHEVVIQPLSSGVKECYVELNNPFSPATRKYRNSSFIIDTSKLAEINNMIISMQVNNIYEPYSQYNHTTGIEKGKPNFYGRPDNSILMSKYIELTSLKEVVKEIIPGVSTTKKNDRINFKLVNKYLSQPFENAPLVLVDGVPIYDLEKVLAISSRDLEKIDVFTTRYFISDIVLDGILHFISGKGDLNVIDFDRSVFRVEYELPEHFSKFYSPDYSADSLKSSRVPDFRNTLYWNPDMHTDKAGMAEAEFYSSDESAEYVIKVEGITPDGKRGTINRSPGDKGELALYELNA